MVSTYRFSVPSIGHTINRMEIITIITRINVLEILVKMKRHGFMASSFRVANTLFAMLLKRQILNSVHNYIKER